MKRIALWAALLLPCPAMTANTPETVVLLHGLGLGSWAMTRMESALIRDGYRVINLSYLSRTLSLETLAGNWLPQLLRTHGVEALT